MSQDVSSGIKILKYLIKVNRTFHQDITGVFVSEGMFELEGAQEYYQTLKCVIFLYLVNFSCGLQI